ncbi:hypothetical protein HNR23_004466 [Nocardiopsis mwathae]|uniref:Uncharacterized protein n=1 Tax=Nocardiopsis mwathae TaxID=1472723 RepID=A0A7W9YMR3_9ACTN|nr:hypothetical protein [Nocardiopsis mwathae]
MTAHQPILHIGTDSRGVRSMGPTTHRMPTVVKFDYPMIFILSFFEHSTHRSPGEILALAYRIRTLAPQHGNEPAELTRAQPGERGIQDASDTVITADTVRSSHP